MKTLILILSILTVGLSQKPKEYHGLEIYQVQRFYPDFTKKERPECYYCLDPKLGDLFEKPLLTESDFKEFDWENCSTPKNLDRDLSLEKTV